MSGHDGQSIMLSPSLDLAIVRLGLTPSATRYDVKTMNARIVAALAPPVDSATAVPQP